MPSPDMPSVTVSYRTARLAHLALLHMERGIRSWVEAKNEDDGPQRWLEVRTACEEIATAAGVDDEAP